MHKKADERKSINACVNLSANNFCITFLKVEPETKVCFKSKNEEKLNNIGFYFDQVKNVLLILGPTT